MISKPVATPFFSVIIPTYNRADLIKETIHTVLSQTYPHFEVLVIDNNSTDKTEEVIKPFLTDNRVRYIRNEKNFERAYSRNIGLKNASGDFLTLLDSDDFMHPETLDDAANFIMQNNDIKVFQNLAQMVNDKREFIYKMTYPALKNQYKAFCRGNFMGAIGGFIHKEVYNKYRFNENPRMIGSEDYEFWFQILANYKVGRINKVNSSIREHPQRSVHTDMYGNLSLQSKTISDIIKKNSHLNEKFGPYLGTLSASFKLQEIIANYTNYSFFKKLKLLIASARLDGSVIFTKRFFSVFKNIFIK